MGSLYSWPKVTERTLRVYDVVAKEQDAGMVASLCRYYKCGPLCGKLAVAVMMVMWLYWQVLEWLWPAAQVEPVPSKQGACLAECTKPDKQYS